MNERLRGSVLSALGFAGVASICFAVCFHACDGGDESRFHAPAASKDFSGSQWGPDHVEPTYPDEVPAFVGPQRPTEADLGEHSPETISK